jgi:hypothetical protein
LFYGILRLYEIEKRKKQQMASDSAVKEGTEEVPTSKGSDSTTGQQGLATDASVVKQLSDLQKTVETLTRSLQSDKDRAVKNTNKRLDGIEGDLKTVLQTAQRDGKNISDVLTAIDAEEERASREALMEMAKAFKSGQFQPKPQGSGEGTGVDVSGVLEDLDLPLDDVRVKEFRSRQFASEGEAYREGAKLQKTMKTTQPSDADIPSPVARSNAPAPKQEALMAEYKEGSKNLYGRQLLLYKQEMRNKGLEIS